MLHTMHVATNEYPVKCVPLTIYVSSDRDWCRSPTSLCMQKNQNESEIGEVAVLSD